MVSQTDSSVDVDSIVAGFLSFESWGVGQYLAHRLESGPAHAAAVIRGVSINLRSSIEALTGVAADLTEREFTSQEVDREDAMELVLMNWMELAALEHYLVACTSIRKLSRELVEKAYEALVGGAQEIVQNQSYVKEMQPFIDKLNPFARAIGNSFVEWAEEIRSRADRR